MRKKYIVAALLWMGLVWFLSSRPGEATLPLPWNLDKAAHLAAYAVLGWLLGRGMGARGTAGIVAALLGALYGAVDEWHQYFVPGRLASAWDWAADAAGSWAGVALSRGRHRAGRTGRPAGDP